MRHISIELENCYGIRSLKHDFDFSQRSAYAIYAPNGSMKSSLAQTFKDFADGNKSLDRIFPARVTIRKVKDEKGKDLAGERVLVLPPYDELFEHTEKTSTLLVNNTLRKEYQQLHIDLDRSKASFVKAMREQSGSKKALDDEIALSFMKTAEGDAFYRALERVNAEVSEQKDAPFASVVYDIIFDERVLSALGTKDFTSALHQYVDRYNELLVQSTYFKKGVFEYYNASQIAKTLADNGFFDAQHTITLHAARNREVTTQEELEELIKKEFDNITKDSSLRKTFENIKKALEKNVTVRAFKDYICDNEFLLPHLANIEDLREKIWKSYFKVHESLYNDALDQFRRVKSRRAEIEEAARKERTQWEAAIDLFNDRFFVPFKLEARNKAAVALGHNPMLDLSYTFTDGADQAPVEKDTLLKALSQGEKKALYILNIIFEIEVRRGAKQETLFVVDDIADSFDYKNKYAIIQYLEDISDGPLFKQIILTHNFDFYRTISSRFVGYPGCLMARKNATETVLLQAEGIKNIFINDWKKAFFSDDKKKVASVPFMRNLIEFTRGENDPDFIKLTAVLHWQSDSPAITVRDLDTIYHKLFQTGASSGNPDSIVVDLIETVAKKCLKASTGANFENKIVLSIAIRLASERFMVAKIADQNFVDDIKLHQTRTLLEKFERMFPNEMAAIKTVRDVVLMTPENIHLNAFMYEPILDMSDEHLRKLYAEVLALK
jgi:hypothetical protein